MRSTFGSFVLSFIIVAGMIPARAQTTLASLIDEVRAANPSLSAARAAVRMSESRTTRAAAWDPPLLRVALMDIATTSLHAVGDARDKRVSLEQMIPFPGKKGADRAEAEAYARGSREDARRVWHALRSAVIQVYAEMQSTLGQQAILEEQLRLVDRLIGSVEARYSVGKAMQPDLLRLRIERDKVLNDLEVMRSEYQTALAMMNAFRARPAETPVPTLDEYLPDPPSIEPSLVETTALQSRPEVSRAGAVRDAASHALRSARRQWWPDIMVGAGYRESMLMGKTWEVMLGVGIPIAPWSSGMVSGMVEEHEAALEESEEMLQMISYEVRAEAVAAAAAVRARWYRLRRYTDDIVPAARQSLSTLTTAYLTNQTDFLSLIDAFRMYEMLSMERVQEQQAYIVAHARFEQSLGLGDSTRKGRE